MSGQADKVSHASLNGIYVKAQELDRGHNAAAAPVFAPPGSLQADADSHASDAQTHASGAADAESHASTHASDAETGADARASDAGSHATSHATE